MNIISKLKCLLMVHVTNLSIDDFCALCTEYDCKKSKLAKLVLENYFNSYAPDDAEVRRIYEGSDKLKLLYFKNIRKGRKLTPYEQSLLVRMMPIDKYSRFPSRLDKQYLFRLFDLKNKPKLAAYVNCFGLPTDLELQLVDLCAHEEPTKCSLDSYRYILLRYLSAKAKKMQTQEVQLAVLALDDRNLTLALVANCTMEENILFENVQRYLVENAERDVLSSLLLHSFIASDELSRKMLERFPDLKWMHEISRLRRPMRKLEVDSECFLGIVTPSKEELDFICRAIEKNVKEEGRNDFVQYILEPMLQHRDLTPYFCAWAADEFPEVAEKAYRKVRAKAEAYRDYFKSAKK